MADKKPKAPKKPSPKIKLKGPSHGPRPQLAKDNIPTRFKPGTSGNPGGRPHEFHEVNAAIRERIHEQVEDLYGIAFDPDQPAQARINAHCAIMDRGLGKPAVAVAVANVPPGAKDTVIAGADGLSVLLGATRVQKTMLGHDGKTTEERIDDATKIIADAARGGMSEAGLRKLVEQLKYVREPIEASAKPLNKPYFTVDSAGRAQPFEDVMPASTSPSPVAETNHPTRDGNPGRGARSIAGEGTLTSAATGQAQV